LSPLPVAGDDLSILFGTSYCWWAQQIATELGWLLVARRRLIYLGIAARAARNVSCVLAQTVYRS